MPSPLSWNRREFNITQNGYFTILKSAGWFSAVPLPGGFRYFVSKPKGAAPPEPTAVPTLESTFLPQLNSEASTASQQTTIRLQTIDSSTSGRQLIRLGLIVLAATGLTWLLLLYCS
jgi:hypothetical protein